MTKTFKKILLSVILLWNTVWLVCCAAERLVSCLDFFALNETELMQDTQIDNISTKALVTTFCKKATQYKCEYDGYHFDAKQSVFLSILCSNVWVMGDFLSETEMTWDQALLKKYEFVSFDIYNYVYERTKQKTTKDFCNYKESDMNSCDLSYFVPGIFDNLMNDYFNIRQATTMWISTLWENFNKEEYANTYVNEHFPGFKTLYPEGICKSEYYQKTCKYLKNYMWQVRNLLTTTKIINVKNLSSDASEINCDSDFNTHILYCGLMWSQDLPLYSLLRVVYNEYFWYNLFMSYYQYNFQSVYGTSQYGNILSPFVEKANKSQEQVYRSKQAISQALSSLSRVEYSLPIHVWFLMYQEDLNLFMWSLPKIYTPLRTLSDKLQNVQDADS